MQNKLPALHLLRLNVPILQQLRIEEALLRADTRNWCLINEGTSPAIVMGISGKPELLVCQERMSTNPLPLIKRFSGGGTVVVDHNTFFVTFICNSNELQVPCNPKEIFSWSESFYEPALRDIGFRLEENDYVIGKHKCGGNAQYIKKDRWLHHTSFLWDYSPDHMDYLLMPAKKPLYRQERHHHEFLCRLCHYLPSKASFEDRIQQSLSMHFNVHASSQEHVDGVLGVPHRQATTLITSMCETKS